MRARLVLLVTLAACDRPTHVEGNHPVEGVADGELRHDADAYYCSPDTERCSYGTVDKVGRANVHFYFRHAPRAPGFQIERTRVIPASRIKRGDVVELMGGDWELVNTVARGRVVTTSGSYEYKDLRVPTARAEALDRHDRRLMIGVGAVATLLAIAVLVLARWLQHRVGSLRLAASDQGASITAAEAQADTLAVLRCQTCATPVQLAAAPTVECAGCHAAVAVPADYVSLVASRTKIAERLPREAAALVRARIIGHPLGALLLLGAAYGAWHAYLAITHVILGSGSGSAGTVVQFVLAFPMLFLPIAFVVAAIGQLTGGRKLASRMPKLAARRATTGYSCRGCGAPLGESRDGVSELCMYCGVQNLITSRLAASATTAKSVASALAVNIRSASASFWASAFAIWVPVLYVVGAIGLILYPFILLVGLST